jgi:hypothetical protein
MLLQIRDTLQICLIEMVMDGQRYCHQASAVKKEMAACFWITLEQV